MLGAEKLSLVEIEAFLAASECVRFSYCAYGLRVSDEFKKITTANSAKIDSKTSDERSFVSLQAESVTIPPNSFALERSEEYFRIPGLVLAICVGNSTYCALRNRRECIAL